MGTDDPSMFIAEGQAFWRILAPWMKATAPL